MFVVNDFDCEVRFVDIRGSSTIIGSLKRVKYNFNVIDDIIIIIS